jgi:hypothetical protein
LGGAQSFEDTLAGLFKGERGHNCYCTFRMECRIPALGISAFGTSEKQRNASSVVV